MGGWVGGLSLSLRSMENECEKESQLEREKEETRRRAWSYPLCCAHFCRLPDRLKGLGCTIPFIHCSLRLLPSDTAIPPYIVASHFPFAAPSRLLRGIEMFLFVILFVFTLSFPKSTRLFSSSSFFHFVESPFYLKSRRKHLNFTVVKCILYTSHRDNLVSVCVWMMVRIRKG